MIKLVRVDHRLLHGQVIFSWTKQLSANYIIVADDKVPNDPISMMALSIAKPADCELSIIPFSKVKEVVGKAIFLNEEELASTKELISMGKKIIIQMVPTSPIERANFE